MKRAGPLPAPPSGKLSDDVSARDSAGGRIRLPCGIRGLLVGHHARTIVRASARINEKMQHTVKLTDWRTEDGEYLVSSAQRALRNLLNCTRSSEIVLSDQEMPDAVMFEFSDPSWMAGSGLIGYRHGTCTANCCSNALKSRFKYIPTHLWVRAL